MYLNHPETMVPGNPNLVPGKSVSHETNPLCQQGWGMLL